MIALPSLQPRTTQRPAAANSDGVHYHHRITATVQRPPTVRVRRCWRCHTTPPAPPCRSINCSWNGWRKNQLAFKINWFARFSWNNKQSTRALARVQLSSYTSTRRGAAVVDAIGGAEREKIAQTAQGNTRQHTHKKCEKALPVNVELKLLSIPYGSV